MEYKIILGSICLNVLFISCSTENLSEHQHVDNKEETSKACDRSCLGHCRHPGPKGCEVCRNGFVWDRDYGCLDVDECFELPYYPCQGQTFCVNAEGTYICYECDRSCDGCTGDGPDMCKACAEGYKLKNGFCSSTIKKKTESAMEFSRYGTYFGLCLATYIIFRKNVFIASMIGAAVATYIGFAEYTIGDAPPLNPLEALANQQF